MTYVVDILRDAIGYFFPCFFSMFIVMGIFELLLFKRRNLVAFVVVQDSQNTISTYELWRGKIVKSTSNGVDSMQFDLDSVHNNSDAIKLIKEQVRENNGTIIAIHQ